MTTNAKGMKPSDITNEIVMEIKYALYELSHVQHGERCFTPRKWAQIEAVIYPIVESRIYKQQHEAKGEV